MTGLLLSRDMAPCCGEVKPSGSRHESLSSSEKQSASAEVSEDTLIRSQLTSCGGGGGRKEHSEAVEAVQSKERDKKTGPVLYRIN